MKALVATDYVPLDRITVTDHPTPTPEPGQVLIKVEAAALNPLDLALITGAMKDIYPVDHPLVIGMDAAGTVAEVGEGVSGYAPGDPVLAFAGFVGAVAQYTVASPGPLLARRPPGLESLHAACIPESGLTAVCLLRAVRLAAGESVLVIGARRRGGGDPAPGARRRRCRRRPGQLGRRAHGHGACGPAGRSAGVPALRAR
ncbi:alcohol dehydrogenase catalytic domain-containing protein [Streptomyces sp. V1I1]|uniref:alcohol dehydrogenase catalytic domain-containing protein n=1 Tax=Streptomyces sp. V1I1 TaxID=3042272 RepID=UPI0027D8EFB8|nr:alcohol dehydrogenase catalytic domain-containing protein [Streptomyces sp. V1I1]